MILFIVSTKTTTAANAIFLQAAAPMYVLVLAPWLLRERVTRADLATMAVIAVGLALILGGAPRASVTAPNPTLGNTLGAISGFTLALSTIGLRWLGTRQDGDRATATTIVLGNLLASAICLPLALPVVGATAADWAIIVYLGVFQLGLGYLFFTRGLRGVPAVEASMLMLIEPSLNPLWVWLLHGEEPGLLPVLGGLLILAATVARTRSARQ